MTNEEAMQILTDMGLHEGGIDNWVADNAWWKFANVVAEHERKECAEQYLRIMRNAVKDAVEREREACAKAMQPMLRDMISRGQAAEIIRARGDNNG